MSKIIVVFLLLLVALTFSAPPVFAQCWCPQPVWYGCPVYSAPVYVHPPVYLSPPTTHIHVCPPVIYQQATPLEDLPAVDQRPQPTRVWHPPQTERKWVPFWRYEWRAGEWVNDPSRPGVQIKRPDYQVRIEDGGWEYKTVPGYYTYVYPDQR
jgi:hypothetical protein